MKNRRLVTGDNSINIQADKVEIILPEELIASNNNPLDFLEKSLSIALGLRESSFLKEAAVILEYIYINFDYSYQNKATIRLLATLAEDLALLKMDLGYISGGDLSAIPLFLKASRLWKASGDQIKSIFDVHMLGVCCGISGANNRAIAIYTACRANIPKTKKFESIYAHVTRDLGIALNRKEEYAVASNLLQESADITSYWGSSFNFGLDVQKLAIAYAGMKKFDEAYKMLELSSLHLEEKDDLTYVKNLNAKHFFYIKLGNKVAAKKLEGQIIEICDKKFLTHQKSVTKFQSLTGKVK